MKKFILFVLVGISLLAQSNLDEANKLMLKSKFSEASNLLEKYTDEYNYAEVYLKLGICYKNLMKNNKALSAIEKANELNPGNEDILTNLASLYATVGFDIKAISTFENVIMLNSANTFAKISLAKLYIDGGRWNNAKSIYKNLMEGDSSNSFYYRQLGYIFQKEDNWDAAYKFYKTACQLNNADLFTISNFAKVHYQKEQPDSAIAILDKGLEMFQNNTQLLKLKSDIYFSIKNYSGAVNAIVRLIANGDESAQLYQRLGICYYHISVENFVGEAQIKKLESAIDALDQSSSIDSTQSLTELYLGMTYKELDKNDDAITHFQKAIELIYPNFTSAIYTNLAIVFNRAGNYAEAIRSFKSAMDFDKDNPNYLYYLASTYDQYYYDKYVPLIYYQMFVSSHDTLDLKLKNYALDRIEELKESVHFQNGANNK